MFEIWADELPNGKWKYKIELPLINQTVKSISTTQVNAMKNASDKAAKRINANMQQHPELKIRNMFKGQEWIFTEDENARFKCAGRTTFCTKLICDWYAKISRNQEGNRHFNLNKYWIWFFSPACAKKKIKKWNHKVCFIY